MAAFLLVAAGVAGLLAWDTEKYRGSDGYLHGPHDAWQIWCLVGVLLVVAAFVGLRSEWLTGAVESALGAVLGAAIVGSVAGGAEYFLVGAFVGAFYALAVFLGVLLVAGPIYAVRTRQ